MLRPSGRPVVMPYPREMTCTARAAPGEGSVNFSSVAVLADDAIARSVVPVFERELQAAGLRIGEGGYHISLGPLEGTADEEYRLEVTEEGACIEAGTYAGLYYGVQTLAQVSCTNG